MGIKYGMSNIMHRGKNLSRVNLEQCYNFGEYNKTYSYGRENLRIAGMKELLIHLDGECEKYKADIAAIAGANRDKEARQYQLWSKWHKAKQVCLWAVIVFVVLWVTMGVAGSFLDEPLAIRYMTALFGFLIMLGILAFIVLKVGEVICADNYSNFARAIFKEIEYRNMLFANTAREYYKKADDMYLASLDPAHREMVLMRREQAEYNNEMLKMERERLAEQRRASKAQEDMLEEQKRAGRAQEQLLDIELERERRRRGY